jgi:hypothetical protein
MRHHLSPQIEIIVQDNSTNGETQAVVAVASNLDRRIRYSQSPYPTSQRHNFELGLGAARGQYLSIIGDDDGYAIGSLDWLAERLARTPVDAVRWNLLHYVWPSLSQDGEGFMDLYPSMCFGGSSIEPALPLAEKIILAKMAGSWENILVYHGMISRSVYDRMKSMTNGVFFPYPMPDVYAHNVIPFFCHNYLQVNDIVSIYGVSGHSAGASWTRARSSDGTDGSAEGNRWMAESVDDEIAKSLPWQPDIRTLRYHDFAAFKIAEQFNMLGGRTIDTDVWISAMIAEIRMNPAQLEAWRHVSPKAAFDEIVIKAVLRKFQGYTPPLKAISVHKKAPDIRIPSLRVAAVDENLRDDVEGAMLALYQLNGNEKHRYNIYENKIKKTSVSSFYSLIIKFRNRFPVFCSRVINSKFMPRSLWIFLKNMHWKRNERCYALTLDIKRRQSVYESKLK